MWAAAGRPDERVGALAAERPAGRRRRSGRIRSAWRTPGMALLFRALQGKTENARLQVQPGVPVTRPQPSSTASAGRDQCPHLPRPTRAAPTHQGDPSSPARHGGDDVRPSPRTRVARTRVRLCQICFFSAPVRRLPAGGAMNHQAVAQVQHQACGRPFAPACVGCLLSGPPAMLRRRSASPDQWINLCACPDISCLS
jgi:hypothetical protein